MQQSDDRTPAPGIDYEPPPADRRRTVLILIAVALVLAIGVALHLTGVVGPS